MSIEDQIARDAADKCVKISNDAMCYQCFTASPNTVEDFLPDILAAIKRAVAIEREISKIVSRC